MEYYKFKFVCKRCKATHWYRPKTGCQKCGKLLLEKIKVRGENKVSEELELNLDIDRLRLDDEWVKHPKEYHVWADHAASCQFNYDRAKSELELTKAEIDRDVRQDPSNYGLAKISEVAITNTIILQSEYQAATKTVNSTRHELECARAAVSALEQRKRQLTVLVELFIRDYYSEATIRKTDEVKDFEKGNVRSRGRKRRQMEQEDERKELE